LEELKLMTNELQRLDKECDDGNVASRLTGADGTGSVQDHNAYGWEQKRVADQSNRRELFVRVAATA
jgi:hypothetical protein